jgi:hypothetical protein
VSSTRRSYLEALLQWAEWLTLCDLLVKLVQYTLFDLLVSVCLDWMTVVTTERAKLEKFSLPLAIFVVPYHFSYSNWKNFTYSHFSTSLYHGRHCS